MHRFAFISATLAVVWGTACGGAAGEGTIADVRADADGQHGGASDGDASDGDDPVEVDANDASDAPVEVDTGAGDDPVEADANDASDAADDTSDGDAAGDADAVDDTAHAADAVDDTAADACAPVEVEPAPVESDLAALAPTEPGHVRAVWLTPKDRPFPPGLHARLETWLALAQSFFADELARWTGEARTFTPQRDAAGRWDVVFMRGEHELAFYHAHAETPDAGGEALREIFQRVPAEFHRDATLVYFYDTAVADGPTLAHTGQLGSAAPWQGDHAGYALIGSHALGFGFDAVASDPSRQVCVFEDTRATGLQDFDGEGVWRELDRGQWASTFVGAAVHELGHAFGLEHVFDDADGDGVEDNLMGNGFRRFGGRFTARLPQPPTLLGPTSATALAPHPFLAPPIAP